MRGKIITNLMFYLMTAAMFAVFFFGCKKAQSSENPSQNQTVSQASPTAVPISEQIPPIEIKSDEVSILTFETVYKDYFEEGAKCRKTYNEYFGNADGVGSSSSPCTINLSFERGGAATKTIEIRRYDKAAKEFKVIEKSVWMAKISREQFDALAKTVTENEAFKAWRDGTMINVSNSKVSATHQKGTRTVMSNVDKSAVAYIPMVEAFKRLDGKFQWEKVQ